MTIHIPIHRNCENPDSCEHGWTTLCGAWISKETEAEQRCETEDCEACIAEIPAHNARLEAAEARREDRLDDNEYRTGLALAYLAGGGTPGQ